MPEQFGHMPPGIAARPSRIDRRVIQRAVAADEHFVERRAADDLGAFGYGRLSVSHTPTTYHGVGNFEGASGLVAGARFQALFNAYLLWCFLGWVGAHRIYLKSPLSATIQTVLLLLGATLFLQDANRAAGLWLMSAHGLWRLADLFLIPGLVRDSAEIEA